LLLNLEPPPSIPDDIWLQHLVQSLPQSTNPSEARRLSRPSEETNVDESRKFTKRMPYIENRMASGSLEDSTKYLFARDFKTQVTPNETQRNTLIVAGVYIVAIAILWWVL
jgi:hypothetical protein